MKSYNHQKIEKKWPVSAKLRTGKQKEYNHLKIEKKWQLKWETNKTYKTASPNKKKKFYVLDMFPYPSGAGLHVGHPRGYIGSDVYARMKRMSGYNVLHPMGYDAFGLPAEQYALEHKIHPRRAVEKNIKTFRSQLDKIGFSYDWSREVNTTDPEYYKWTQWIFLQMYQSYYNVEKKKARPISELVRTLTKTDPSWKTYTEEEKEKILMKYRLAYEGYSEVNWCPQLGTVLANDEIVDGPNGELLSERGNYPVEKKSMRQWFMRITAYADRLLDGLGGLTWPEHIKEIQKNWIGKSVDDNGVATYTMRDAIFARQRYWGEPIPLMHKNGTIIPLEEKKLPLTLPNVTSYEPIGTGESPLAGVSAWMKAGYETNTMPGWAGSSWYFLRYMDPKNKKALADKKALAYWRDVDVYIGGAEHATGHLLYARFWHMFLHDIGVVPTKEPFKLLKNQGLILASDGRKMSKRWGNVINPDEIVKTYGADTLRVYEMFMGPFDQSLPWSTESIIGSRRFIEKICRLESKVVTKYSIDSKSIDKAVHKIIKKVTDDIEGFAFNTAISAMMVFLNDMEKSPEISKDHFKKFLQLVAPFAPHIAEELWCELGEKKSIHISAWPKYDARKVVDEEITIAVSVNGKVRSEITISRTLDEEEVKKCALADAKILPWIEGKEIRRVIYVTGRLVNIVI